MLQAIWVSLGNLWDICDLIFDVFFDIVFTLDGGLEGWPLESWTLRGELLVFREVGFIGIWWVYVHMLHVTFDVPQKIPSFANCSQHRPPPKKGKHPALPLWTQWTSIKTSGSLFRCWCEPGHQHDAQKQFQESDFVSRRFLVFVVALAWVMMRQAIFPVCAVSAAKEQQFLKNTCSCLQLLFIF